MDEHELYLKLDLYGNSEENVYSELEQLYKIYTSIGGYPAVVLKYLETKSIEDSSTALLKILKLFVNESKRYFEDILDDAIYENMFSSIARILVKEKKDSKKTALVKNYRI